MEKIDVEMEDVTKHPQDLGDDGKIKLSEVDTEEEQNKVEELKDTKIEANEANNVVKEVVDPNKTVISEEGVKESEDSINVTSEVQENAEVQDNNDVAKEDIMETENANNVQDEGVKEIDNANNVTNGQPNVKSETNNVVNEKDSEDAVIEKTASEQGQPPVNEVANDVADEVANEVSKSVNVSIPDAVEETNKEETVIEVKEVENKVTCNGDGEKVEIPETKTENKVVMERVNVAKEEADNKDIPEGITAATPVKAKHEIDDHEPATPNVLAKCSIAKAGNHSGETHKNVFYELKMPGNDDGTPEEQMAFMRELETFSRERATEFKPPKFYGHQLNCLKLWRHVIRLGGYDRVTGSKLWRQVGESFHPPKTCTTVSWTFRIFYEKALLEYERYKRDSGELQLPISPPDSSVGAADPEGNGFQASGSGRVRRDSAARAMQGWHNDPSEKSVSTPKREKNLKSIGSLKQKRPNEVDTPVKTPRNETSRELVASVVDVGSPPADWVKISVRETRDSFEVYALVPGLLREEVRVQSDPAGRLVITGTPEQAENPWGISAFKKVVSLPGRIDPLQTSAVVSLHGRLYVKVPFEQGN